MLFLQNGKGVRIGAILRRGLLLTVSWLGVTSHAEAATSQKKKSGGVLASALEEEKTLAEKQLDVYGHIQEQPVVRILWAKDPNFYTLPADQLREVEQAPSVKEREELAVRFFLENKWGALWGALAEAITIAKTSYLKKAAIALVGWAAAGGVIYALHKEWLPVPGGWAILSTIREHWYLYIMFWGGVVSFTHAYLHEAICTSIPQWQMIGLLLISLTGVGSVVQIVVIYFAECDVVDKIFELDEPMQQLRHPYDPFEEVQLEYIRQKYGPGLRNEELCTRLEIVGRDFYTQALGKPEQESQLITYVREGLALYRALTPLTREERAAYREEILEKTWEKLQYYHPDVQKKIYDMVDAYLHGGRVYGRILAGPPGTGKTELAKTLASLFPDGECVEIKLGGRSPAELGGDAEGRKGYFVEALLQVGRAGKKVRVICFDEMEKALDKRAVNNRELLTAVLSLENGEYCLYSAHFHAHFVLQVMRFYPVNSKEELERNEALLNRLPVVDIPGYSAEAKYKLYTEEGGMLDKMMAAMGIDPARKDDPEVLAMLKELIAMDKDLGLRTLEDQVSMALTRMKRRWRKEASSSAAA